MTMGCVHSQHNGDLFNEDKYVRRKFYTGIHIAKSSEGVEGNFQLALEKTRKKNYQKVATAQEQSEDNDGD